MSQGRCIWWSREINNLLALSLISLVLFSLLLSLWLDVLLNDSRLIAPIVQKFMAECGAVTSLLIGVLVTNVLLVAAYWLDMVGMCKLDGSRHQSVVGCCCYLFSVLCNSIHFGALLKQVVEKRKISSGPFSVASTLVSKQRGQA